MKKSMSSAAFSFFASTLVGLGVLRLGAAWPVKVFDFSEDGRLCRELPNNTVNSLVPSDSQSEYSNIRTTSTEQYMHVEVYDFHDYPKFAMTWRKLTGACGAEEPGPIEWTGSYDSSDGDEPPDADGRVQLSLYFCAPFGEYELELVVESTSADGSSLLQRTAWQVENGDNQYDIWDTLEGPLFVDPDYAPTVPGTYVWPLPESTGYYSTLYAGPLPPIECPDSIPDGTEYQGCYEDNAGSRTLGQDQLKLPGKENPTGMTLQVCADFCSDYQYFGVEFGYECFCGTSSEFEVATTSDVCGSSYEYLCTGDSTVACGGVRAISIYEQTDATPPPTPAPTPSPDDNPRPTPAPTPSPDGGPAPTPAPSSYTSEGCFVDSKSNRIMGWKSSLRTMSAEICFDLCNDGVNDYFGTQFSNECWCGVDTDLTANGDEAMESECDMDCAGTTTGEKCGGRDRMSAYKIPTDSPTYVGCYGDAKSPRAMPGAGKYSSRDMTNEFCWDRCSTLGYAYAGTQYGIECWCDNSFDLYGTVDRCDIQCGGDANQICGGFDALSVYEL